MRIGAVPENPVEWVIVRLNVAPRPLLETQMAYTLARLIMVGTTLGVFAAFDRIVSGVVGLTTIKERSDFLCCAFTNISAPLTAGRPRLRSDAP